MPGEVLRASSSLDAARRVLENGVYLLAGYAGKPLKELVHRGTAFEIFE